MIRQFIQLLELILFGRVHLLVFFSLIKTSLISAISIKAKHHKRCAKTYHSKTTALIPVFREDANVLEKVLEAAKKQTDQLVVVCDEPTKQLLSVCRKYADDLVVNSKKVGKRWALPQGLKLVKNPITVLIDSDTIIHPGAVSELIRPFSDDKVGIIQGQPIPFKRVKDSKFALALARLIENSRDVTCRALNPHLIVVDGRFQAIRTALFREINDAILNDKWRGKNILTGDDRSRTRNSHKQGYVSRYQPNAKCHTLSQPTIWDHLGQQIRWRRTGYIYFVKDISERAFPSFWNAAKSFQRHLSPIFFAGVILMDTFILPRTILVQVNPILVIPLMFIGSCLTTLLRQLIRFGYKKVEYKWIPFYAFFGLFIGFPSTFYAMLTLGEACKSWMTR